MDTQQNRSGGPSTPSGKETSSGNSFKHGGCSKQVIVKGENREDFEALESWWLANYDVEQGMRPLLEEAVLNEWLLKRTQRNYLAVEARLAESDANEWTAEDMHRLALMQRYKTAAERAFHRSWAALERFRRTRVYEGLAEARAEAQKEEREQRKRVQEEAKAPKKLSYEQRLMRLPQRAPVPNLTQWVRVSQDGEDTVTTLTPSNEELLKEAEAMDPKPVRVYRKMYIDPWLATEYEWVPRDLPGESRHRMQVMTFEEWLKALEREKYIQGGHIGPVERDTSFLTIEEQLEAFEKQEKESAS